MIFLRRHWRIILSLVLIFAGAIWFGFFSGVAL